jgi:hypothetical protein
MSINVGEGDDANNSFGYNSFGGKVMLKDHGKPSSNDEFS